MPVCVGSLIGAGLIGSLTLFVNNLNQKNIVAFEMKFWKIIIFFKIKFYFIL